MNAATRPPIVTDEVVERLVAAIEAIKSPYDHHRQTGEDCAFGDALEAAEQAVRKAISAMPTIDQDGGEV